MTTDQVRWRIGVGSDNLGFALKQLLAQRMADDHRVVEVVDYGVPDEHDSTAYPHVGLRAAEAVARGEVDRAVLVCGTGIGMSISANKVPGVRASVAADSYSVQRSVLSNNCQVLCFGARVIGPELAATLLDEWLGHVFDEASPSQRKVAVISDYEQREQGLAS
ncbi:ribose-5-phosphate isomerase [Goodfellowiella coeruleoviolacea]|uniref:D-erythrulose 4-phosphate isomerase n=1 Tax=Goodfellowiella coeruleoviolacea TaxID=334858 RepID=A0AAE3KFL0_9PSEU|nr:ribose-5-phosphate isomerase [Goodfellowiella coeruleoviolacea]MCP2164524.1 ribose 5-phosphate isomerase B [Goodfellowiella coeruleoviolacea]